MRTPVVSLLPLLLLTLLAGATFWLERASQLESQDGKGKERHDPDFIIENFTTRRFNLDGSLQHLLTAQRMLHYADDDTTEAIAPSLIHYGHRQPTRLAANHAWISKDGKEVLLSEDVRMVRDAAAGDPPLVVTTSELRAYPDDGTARTDVPVTITHGQSTFQGNAMEANNRTHTVSLLGRAHGTLYKSSREKP